MRSPKEIKDEIRQLKDDMKQQGLRVTSMMNRQDSMEAGRANGRLFALKLELEQAEKQGNATPEKVRSFVRTQGVEPQNLTSRYVLDALAMRFNTAHGTRLTVSEFSDLLNKNYVTKPGGRCKMSFGKIITVDGVRYKAVMEA